MSGESAWDARVEAYRQSPGHREGPDLDTLIEWAGAGEGRTALDVATGGGHVARRLREAGFAVTSCDASAGMEPDVVCPAESLPFPDGHFDVVVTRIAPHHFQDVQRAVREMARVSREQVLVEDTLYADETVEAAYRLHDSTHVRAYTEAEWRDFLEGADLVIEGVTSFEKHHPLDAWLARAGCQGEAARQVRELLADRIVDGVWTDVKILLRTRKPQTQERTPRAGVRQVGPMF